MYGLGEYCLFKIGVVLEFEAVEWVRDIKVSRCEISKVVEVLDFVFWVVGMGMVLSLRF